MAHAAMEGLEVVTAVAELADVAIGALDRHRHPPAEEALVKEKAENDRLRSELDMYRNVIHEFQTKGLLQHMDQLNGMDSDQLCDRLKERVDSPEFLEKLSVISKGENAREPGDWVVLEDESYETGEYVFVTQEDVVDGIAVYMAEYLASQPKTKNMSPDQLQKVLSNAFTEKNKVGLLRRVWRTGKVMYTIASWTATIVGLYRNPMLVRAAFMAIRTTTMILLRLLR